MFTIVLKRAEKAKAEREKERSLLLISTWEEKSINLSHGKECSCIKLKSMSPHPYMHGKGCSLVLLLIKTSKPTHKQVQVWFLSWVILSWHTHTHKQEGCPSCDVYVNLDAPHWRVIFMNLFTWIPPISHRYTLYSLRPRKNLAFHAKRYICRGTQLLLESLFRVGNVTWERARCWHSVPWNLTVSFQEKRAKNPLQSCHGNL